jgi:hypothetical protein
LNRKPAGRQSHYALFVRAEGRRVELHQLLGTAEERALAEPEDFGISFIVDGVRRGITRITMWTLEPDDAGACCDSPMLHCPFYGMDDRGVGAFRFIFNSELLMPGDVRRVIPTDRSLLQRMDTCSLRRLLCTLDGRCVPSMLGFDINGDDRRRRGEGVFSFCTCSVVSLPGGGVGFHVFEFDIHYYSGARPP